MAKKKLAAIVKIQIPAGQATPAPPVGTALGPHGINIMDFCKAYNAETESQRGLDHPGRDLDLRGPVVHVHHQDAARRRSCSSRRPGVEKGVGATRAREKVGSVTRAQVRQIAETKMPDLNAVDLEGAMAQVEGTARSMGIEVEG